MFTTPAIKPSALPRPAATGRWHWALAGLIGTATGILIWHLQTQSPGADWRSPASGAHLNLGLALMVVLLAGAWAWQFLIARRTQTEAQKQLALAHAATEAAVRESRLQREALNAHAIVSITNAAGVIGYVNDRFCAISGYAQDELLGKDHRVVSSGRHPPEFWRDFWTTLRAGRIWEGEICNRHKQGRLYWVKATVVPRRNAAGDIDQFVAIRTDITAQKVTAAELQQEQTLFDMLTNCIPDAVYFKDRESRFLRINRQLARSFGLADPAEAIGRTDFDFFDEAHARQAYQDEQRIMASGEAAAAYEEKEVWPDGRVTWVLSTKAPMRDATGTIIGLVGSSRDITASKQADLAMRASEARFRALSDACPIGVFLGDAQHRCVYTNARCNELTGLEGSQRRGLSWLRAVHRDDIRKVRLQWKESAARNAEFAGEFRFRPRAGRTPWIAARARPIMGPDGDLLGYVGTLEDITARREQAENLRSAKEAAEAATKAKSEFLAVISHEIRTPMNSVVGFANLLLDTPLGPQQREYVDILRSAGENLVALINDILDFSKIEAGKLEVDRRRFDCLHTIENIAQTLTPQALAKGLSLQVEIPADTPRILLADPLRVRQVLINLIGNALKFTGQGGVRIAVRALFRTDEDRLRIAIIDTGIGIAADKQARLFQTYTQADASITRQYGGTGLGLAISKQLIELMGGTMGVASTLGQGSCFWFDLPLSPDQTVPSEESTPTPFYAPPPVDAHRTACPSAPVIPPATTPAKRALVVDDNPINLQLAKAFLLKLGYTSMTAVNGREAVQLVQTNGFDLVVMDHQMPVMDGCEATRAIRQWEMNQGAARRLPIIAITANIAAYDESFYLAAGMDALLGKPLLLDRLALTISQITAPPAVPAPALRPPIMDREQALDLAGHDPALLGMVAEAFVGQSQDLLRGLRQAWAERDPVALGQQSHKLKGAVSVFAAPVLWNRAKAMEKIPANPDWAQLQHEIAAIEADVEQLLGELAEIPRPQPAAV